MLICNVGHEAEVADWRVRTMICASLLNLESSWPQEVADFIQEWMAPLWPRPLPAEGGMVPADELFVLLEKVCKEAFEFSLLVRSSNDRYLCELPDPLSPFQDDSEAQSRQPCDDPSLTDETVAYAMSSALVKYPFTDPKRRVKLDKAHVVVF
ncbi:hypothetical protein DL98DRAFT_515022 [Cadophora sp. DSE1049]|nr:hypothetical protein DL98DRAFT_515022 [Cadophora sp. DSE1049]